MSEQITSPGEWEAGLGPVVLRCRPLPPMRWLNARGLSNTYALLGISLTALLPAAAIFLLARNEPQWFKITISSACFVIFCTYSIWETYFYPNGDYLVLHEDGFRLKMGRKRLRVLFQDLQVINFGEESLLLGGKLVNPTRPLETVKAPAAPWDTDLWGRKVASAAMNLHYQAGSEVVIHAFLQRFEPEDMQRFLNYLVENHPELCGAAETSRRISPVARLAPLGIVVVVVVGVGIAMMFLMRLLPSATNAEITKRGSNIANLAAQLDGLYVEVQRELSRGNKQQAFTLLERMCDLGNQLTAQAERMASLLPAGADRDYYLRTAQRSRTLTANARRELAVLRSSP